MRRHYRETGTILDHILARKQEEIAAGKDRISEDEMRLAAQKIPTRPPSLSSVLRNRDKVALIAEVKHASPSRGVLIDSFNPAELATMYKAGGAAAISVLTDEQFFQGHLDHLVAVQQATNRSIPVLRKDFVIDPYQIHEAASAGASAILLIVAALDISQLADLHQVARECGLDALIEVHDEQELEHALSINAALVGINNRDLKTFQVSLDTTARLAKLVPDGVLLVAESGIHTAEDVRRMGELGAHAVLVGEALVSAGSGLSFRVWEFSSQPRLQAAIRSGG